MKVSTKRTGIALTVLACATTLAVGLGAMSFREASPAYAAQNEGRTYHYSKLSTNPRAERFYKAFEDLEQSGAFKKGEIEYDLLESEVLSENDVKAYVNEGDARVPVSYSAGRDAYFMDHPDLFYADVFGTSISAGEQSGKSVAFLDTSRVETLYLGEMLNSEAKVSAAVAEYEKKIAEIVKSAKEAGDTKAQIEYVNQYIAETTEYSYCSAVVGGETVLLPEADYIHTSYGALVNGKAVCDGYAKAFKAVLDRLDIPCVLVQGYSLSNSTASYVEHMWNAVKLEGQWYAVDVTWNSTGSYVGKWLLVGENKLSKTHIADGKVSSSGYELKYPALKPYDYGKDTDDNGMEIKGEYKTTEETGVRLDLTVSIDGKGAKKLQAEGKYLAGRFGDTGENGQIVWGNWFNCVACADFIFPSGFSYDDEKTTAYLHAGMEYAQFALIDYAPDVSGGAVYPDKPEFGELAGKPCYWMYDGSKLTDEHIEEPSSPYRNDGFETYIPAPGAISMTPSNTGKLNVESTYDIKIVYSDSLELMEDKTVEDVKLGVTTARASENLEEYVEVSNFVWDGDKTISFTFSPSKMFIHNSVSYYFYPINLVGRESKKVPDPVTYLFQRKSIVCSKIFNDGRLYMNVFGAPNILDASDLSTTGFKDENGNYYAENQRSQLLLVANRPADSEVEKMNDMLVDDTALEKKDIVASSTYEISLQICGVVRKVPNGSYMQVSFGFPEGYSPDDEGTTFQIYHYKHDDKGNITGVEEIPVIITEYGLIAQVKSFSPFTIVQVKKTSAAVTPNVKSVYASVSGIGGTIATEKAEGKSGIDALTGDSITYTITAESGYQIDRIVLNGKAIDAQRYSNGTLTLNKSELKESNTLEASFVTEKAAKSYEDRGITIVKPDTIVVTNDMMNSIMPPVDDMPLTDDDDHTTAIIIGCVVGAVVLAAGAFTVWFLLRRHKKLAEGEEVKSASNSKKSSAKKNTKKK